MSESQPPPDRDGTPPSGEPLPDSTASSSPAGDPAGNPAGGPYGGPYGGNPPTGNPAAGGPYTGGSYTGSPYTGGPHTGGPYTGGPSGPYTGGPSGPYTGGPSGPYTGGPSGPYSGPSGPYAGGSSSRGGTFTPPGTTTATGFFDSIRGAGMFRPDDRVAAGVAAAVAHKLGIDPLLVRIGFVVLALVGGVGVLAYGLGWLFLPQQDGRIHAQALLAGSVTAGTVGAGVTTVIGVGGFGPLWMWGDRGPDVGGLIALAGIILVIIVFAIGNQQGWFGDGGGRPQVTPGTDPAGGSAGDTRINLSKPGTSTQAAMPYGTPSAATPYAGTPYAGTPYAGGPSSGSPAPPGSPASPVPFTPPPPKPPRRRTAGAMGTLLVVGLALLAAGAVVVADSIDPLSVDVDVVAWATALAVLAGCLLLLGLAGRRSGGLGFIAVIALIGMSASWIASGVPESDDVGQRRWVPTGQLDSYDFQLSAGSAVLDLRQLTPGAGPPVEVEADVSLGELVVQVPDDLTVAVDVTNGIGDVTGVQEGQSIIGPAGPVDVNLTVDVSVGSLVLQEVSR